MNMAARRWHSQIVWIPLFGALLGVGFWMRALPLKSTKLGFAAWKSWQRSTIVTLYFSEGPFLFPVSRRISPVNDVPRVALEALLGGANAESGLVNPIPKGVKIHSIKISDGVAQIDLSEEFLKAPAMAESALVETMTAVPGMRSVSLSVDGKPLGPPVRRVPLIYFASARGLMAVPASATTPRDMVARYLAGPPAQTMTGLPPDVQLLSYDYNPTDHSVALNFSYKPSVRTLALEAPEKMRFVLLGLIASLTEFPEVETVQLDFEGRTRLGVGQCSDLLRTRQPRPELLNDERLLGR